MRKIVTVCLLGLFLSLPAYADLNALTNYRLGSKAITVGDSITKVEKKLGKPQRVVELKNAYGVYQGERWEYVYQKKPLHFFVISDRVTIGNIYR